MLLGWLEVSLPFLVRVAIAMFRNLHAQETTKAGSRWMSLIWPHAFPWIDGGGLYGARGLHSL